MSKLALGLGVIAAAGVLLAFGVSIGRADDKRKPSGNGKGGKPKGYALELQSADSGRWLFASMHDSEIAAHTREVKWRDAVRKQLGPLTVKSTRVRPITETADAFAVLGIDVPGSPTKAVPFAIYATKDAAETAAARLRGIYKFPIEVDNQAVPADLVSEAQAAA